MCTWTESVDDDVLVVALVELLLEQPGVDVDCDLGDSVGAVWPPSAAPVSRPDTLNISLDQVIKISHAQTRVSELLNQLLRILIITERFQLGKV